MLSNTRNAVAANLLELDAALARQKYTGPIVLMYNDGGIRDVGTPAPLKINTLKLWVDIKNQ
jgi:hypothetical protein